MAVSKKWSEQLLVENTLATRDENGNKVVDPFNRLDVCLGGMNLFKKEFMNGKWKGMNKLVVPFDFIVLAGSECPKGKFYELEYQIAGSGIVYRALLQAVNPTTDIRFILGTLSRKNLLPEGFSPTKAWLRNDIDQVMVGYCIKDEDGPMFSGGIAMSKEDQVSIVEYCNQSDWIGVCFEYYRGECREIWGEKNDKFGKPVFVCGSDNVNDPEFEEMRMADMEELDDAINTVINLTEEYNLSCILCVEKENLSDGSTKSTLYANARNSYIKAFMKELCNQHGKRNKKK